MLREGTHLDYQLNAPSFEEIALTVDVMVLAVEAWSEVLIPLVHLGSRCDC